MYLISKCIWYVPIRLAKMKMNKEPTNSNTKSANNNNNKYIYRDFKTCSVSATHLPLCYPFRLFSLQVRARILLLYIVITSSFFFLLLSLHGTSVSVCVCVCIVAYFSLRKKAWNFLSFSNTFRLLATTNGKKILKAKIFHIPNK